MSTDRTALTRRTFVASAGALGALAACGTAANTLYASAPQAFGDESGDGESIDETSPSCPRPLVAGSRFVTLRPSTRYRTVTHSRNHPHAHIIFVSV